MTDDTEIAEIKDTSRIDLAITHLHQSGDTRLIPLFRAVRDQGAALVMVPQGLKIDVPAKIRRSGRPIIALIHDDSPLSCGPAAYDGAGLRWLLHGTTVWLLATAYPPVAWYEVCAMHIAIGGRALIIDTLQEHEDAWFDFLRRGAADAQPLVAAAIGGALVQRLAAFNIDQTGIWSPILAAERRARSDDETRGN